MAIKLDALAEFSKGYDTVLYLAPQVERMDDFTCFKASKKQLPRQ